MVGRLVTGETVRMGWVNLFECHDKELLTIL